ncbi:MAG: hypothetical protein JXA89_25445 [Anaerolineae bacterium]|nr:hypothetical protein [Anaerolineae bacterium]
MTTDLFDRYVREVGRRLPKKQRDDVQTELHSLLMDSLQEQDAQKRDAEQGVEGKTDAADENAAQIAVLKQFGPPAKVAAQYRPPHRYLIGPAVYDIYWIVVAAALGGLTVAYLVLAVLAMWGEPEPLRALFGSFGGVFGSYFGALLSAFGSITLTFAILDRVLPETVWKEDEEEEWDPRTLPEIQDRDRIEVGGLIAESVFIVLVLIAFNAFSEWIGVGFVGSLNDGPRTWHFVPLLSDTFWTYMPVINMLWIANLVLNMVLLRQGRWQRATHIADLILNVGSAFLLYQMVFGPSILTMEAIQSESLRELLGSMLPGLLKLGLGIGLVFTIIEIIQKLFLIVRGERIKPVTIQLRKTADC